MTERSDRPRVVILGGGFGGLGAALELRKADADVVLVDRHDYHTFQPLLYQLATGLLEPSAVGHSIRDLVHHDQDNVTVHKTPVTAIDLDAREVTLEDMAPLSYDVLVLAMGAEVTFFGTEGAAEHAFPMYTLTDAIRLKEHVLGKWEAADKDPGLIEDGALNIVVVGGGPTGVEVAGALSEMIDTTMVHEFPPLAVRAKVHLVDHGQELLKMFADKGHAYAARILEKDGVELLLGTGVKAIGPGHVTLSDGSTIKTRCVIWGGGLMAAPIAGAAGLPQGRGGRIDVQPDFTVAGFPGILVIGDIANIPAKDGKSHPQLGSVALQSGSAAANTILADRAGKDPKPFSYLDKGTMAMIGRGAAVAQVKGVEMHGKLAFAAWLGVHAALMTGGSNRVGAFKSWAQDYFGKDRAPQALDRSGTPRMVWEEDEVDDPAVATA
jgi:NADH dehydrogenase